MAERIEIDVFKEHERLLGKSLPMIVRENCETSIHFDKPGRRLLENLSRAEGKVYVTFNGVVGDSGLNPWVVALRRDAITKQQVVGSSQDYEQWAQYRETVRQFLSETICRIGAPMTTATGMDNRDMLPPFFPGYRNQDGIFNASIRHCIQDSYCGHLPFVLIHDPVEMRRNEPNRTRPHRISEIILECIRCGPQWIGMHSKPEQLIALGQYFSDIGNLPANEFNEWLRLLLLNRVSRLIQRQEALLARSRGQPSLWAQSVTRQLEDLSRAVLRLDFSAPVDLDGQIVTDQILRKTQILLQRFGKLLYWWPEIVRRTMILNSQDTNVGRRLL